MWKLKKINDTDHFLNVQTLQAGRLYKFSLTDFCKLWSVELSKKQIVDQCKDSNKWLEADDETLICETLNLFDVARTDVNWSMVSNRLVLNSTFSGIKFSFHVEFQLADEESFSKIVVSPLLLIIKNLHQQKEFLKDCLKKKDTEIAEYKLDGAVISRKNIETPVFQESVIPNMFIQETQKFSFSKPTDLVDDQIISSYNELFSFLPSENTEANVPEEQEVKRNLNVEKESHELSKIPKKSQSDLIIQVENKNDVPSSSVRLANVIRKRPQPRKLKNL
ncbi:non-homologous end-joining factor 1-like [Planococcus citri]|uniref:non-homologous end-joining factor 1-like n=1 Tax=Planococcus citri TaxID=170843 RepID=UPI0031F8A382